MLVLHSLRAASEEGKGNGHLRSLVTVNRRCKRLHNAPPDVRVACQTEYLCLVLIREAVYAKRIVSLRDTIRLDARGEDREAPPTFAAAGIERRGVWRC